MTLSDQRPTTTKDRRAARAKSSRSRTRRQPGPKNRQALKLLATWMSTPDDRGAAWWRQFERELKRDK